MDEIENLEETLEGEPVSEAPPVLEETPLEETPEEEVATPTE